MLGPAITGEPASTANDFAAASLYKSYTGSAIMPAKRPRVYTPRFGLRLIMPRYAIPLGMARRKAKICPPGTVFDRQHEIFARSYRDQP